MKKSLIQIELLKMPENIQNSTELKHEVQKLVGDLTGIQKDRQIFNFDEDRNILEILFDGDSAKQAIILKKLMEADFPILEYSVPKAGLLENLYLDLVEQENNMSMQDKNIKHKQGGGLKEILVSSQNSVENVSKMEGVY